MINAINAIIVIVNFIRIKINSIIQNLSVEGENNTIGIKDSGPNLIHKNIVIKGDNNIIQGNYIGTNKSGDSPQNVVSLSSHDG